MGCWEQYNIKSKFQSFNFKFTMESKGFTLIELIVVIAIIIILYGVVMFCVTLYINESKDSNISGNLAVLIPAGEVYYNGNGDSYQNFCDPSSNTNGNSVIRNAITQMSVNTSGNGCYNNPKNTDGSADATRWGTDADTGNPAGVCCFVKNPNYDAWVAYAPEFSNPNNIYCVDSRGMKENIPGGSDITDIMAGIKSSFQCP